MDTILTGRIRDLVALMGYLGQGEDRFVELLPTDTYTATLYADNGVTVQMRDRSFELPVLTYRYSPPNVPARVECHVECIVHRLIEEDYYDLVISTLKSLYTATFNHRLRMTIT